MDIQDYYLKVAQMLVSYDYRTWRTGQTYANVLAEVRPDLINLVMVQGIDPYHDDNNIPAFKKFLTENW